MSDEKLAAREIPPLEQDQRWLDSVADDEYARACDARERRDDSGAFRHFRRAASLRRIARYLRERASHAASVGATGDVTDAEKLRATDLWMGGLADRHEPLPDLLGHLLSDFLAGRRGPDEEVDIEALEMADHEAQARRIVSRCAETGDADPACVNCGRSLADHTNAEPYTCPEFTVSTTRATSDQTATPLCASNAGARVEYRVVPATTSRIAKRIQYDEFPRILRRYADALQDIDWPGGIVGVTVLDEVADLLEEIARSARAATPAETPPNE